MEEKHKAGPGKRIRRDAVFQPEFIEDLRYWVQTDRKIALRALAIVEAVLRDPSLVNRDPYGAGWLAKITPADWAYDAAQLVQGVEVEYWAEGEVERYR